MIVITRVRFGDGRAKSLNNITAVWCESEQLDPTSVETTHLPREASVAFIVAQIKSGVPVFACGFGPPMADVEIVVGEDGRELIRTKGDGMNDLIKLPTF